MKNEDDMIARRDRVDIQSRIFGHNVGVMLHRKHISEHDIARMTGLGQGTISAYRHGKQTPTLYNALLVCDALGVDIGKMATRKYDYDFGFKT